MAKPSEEKKPRELAEQFLGDAQFVVVEGFKDSDVPKIEVFRKAVHAEPLYQAGGADAALYKAIVTDDREMRAGIPVLRFSDTAWMYRLIDIVLQSAT